MVLLPGTMGAAGMGGPVSLRGDRKHFWSWGMVGEVERVVDFLANPLASQTRVDTEEPDDVRQIHKELGGCGSVDLSPPPPTCYLLPPSIQPCPLLNLLTRLWWPHLPGGSWRRTNSRTNNGWRRIKKRCPREGLGTNRIDGVRGKSEEKGEKAPASLPTSSSESSAPGWPTLQTGSLLPECIIVLVHIVLLHESS